MSSGDVGEDAEKPMLEDFAKLMALRMKQYKTGCKAAGLRSDGGGIYRGMARGLHLAETISGRGTRPHRNAADHTKKAAQPTAAEDKPARRKYGNRKTQMDGRTFDSQHEADVYARLALETEQASTSQFSCRVAFPLPGGVKYVADFVTLEPDGTFTVYDAKSAATAKIRSTASKSGRCRHAATSRYGRYET